MAGLNNVGAELSAEELDGVMAGTRRFSFYVLRDIVYVTDMGKVVDRVPVPEGAIDCTVDNCGAVHFRFD